MIYSDLIDFLQAFGLLLRTGLARGAGTGARIRGGEIIVRDKCTGKRSIRSASRLVTGEAPASEHTRSDLHKILFGPYIRSINRLHGLSTDCLVVSPLFRVVRMSEPVGHAD